MRRLVTVAAALILTAHVAAAGPQTVDVKAKTIALTPMQPDRSRFGRLKFLGGLALSASDPRFGGFSGLVLAPDGRRMTAVSDDGWLFSASLDYGAARLTGIHAATIAALVGPDGERPRSKWRRDAEALTVWDERGLDGRLLVGFESNPRLELVDPTGGNPTRRLGLPEVLAKGPANGELEALARFPDGPHEGWLIAISERNFDAQGHIRGALWHDDHIEDLLLSRRGDYVVTDMALLPASSRFVTVERSFSPPLPPGMALRLFDLSTPRDGTVLAGEVLLDARQPLYAIDNMEGIAVHRDTNGRFILTVISDDNFNRALQRTIILQFALAK